MKSIEIFLPLNANDGTPFPDAMFDRIENELTETFGGVTAYKRAPAQGRWKSGGDTQGDEIAIFEVVVDRIDRGWWTRFREDLVGPGDDLGDGAGYRNPIVVPTIRRRYRCGRR
jgi:hypothetical protein